MLTIQSKKRSKPQLLRLSFIKVRAYFSEFLISNII